VNALSKSLNQQQKYNKFCGGKSLFFSLLNDNCFQILILMIDGNVLQSFNEICGKFIEEQY
jgi:hypothetical protein